MVTFSSAFSQFSQVADTAGSAKPARCSSKPAEKGGSSKVKNTDSQFSQLSIMETVRAGIDTRTHIMSFNWGNCVVLFSQPFHDFPSLRWLMQLAHQIQKKT